VERKRREQDEAGQGQRQVVPVFSQGFVGLWGCSSAVLAAVRRHVQGNRGMRGEGRHDSGICRWFVLYLEHLGDGYIFFRFANAAAHVIVVNMPL
jgi:hypothetical protein